MDWMAVAAGLDRLPALAADRPVHRPYPTAEPAVRGRVRPQISPAPVPGNPPKDGSQTGRRNPRAGCRRTIPSPPKWRREAVAVARTARRRRIGRDDEEPRRHD